MLTTDPLADFREVQATQLESSSCILFERQVNPYLYDRLREVARPAQCRGCNLHHVMTAEEALQMVVQGLGVAVLTMSAAWRVLRKGVTIRPLYVEGLCLRTVLAARSDDTSRPVSGFVRAFVRSFEAEKVTRQMSLQLPSQKVAS